MADLSKQIMLNVDAGPDADPEDVAELTHRLRNELLELDVDGVNPVRGGPAPAGAKGDPITLSALLVTLAPVVLPALITTVQSWLNRHDRTSLTLERNGEKVVLTGNPSKQQQQIIDAWMSRQKGATA
ncbi:MAG: hypothetical protein LAO21_20490 [Acidobacteriia bacterium]|nr:hypothetical protein [Terriglobia bacterium]